MSSFKKPPLAATALTVIGVAVLCTLGTWQMQRLEWKENLIERINAYDESEMQDLSVNDLIADNEFMKGRLRGKFLFEKEITLKPRTHDGKPGIHVITPLALDQGSTILVNRGWVPLDTSWNQHKDDGINVILRVPREPNMFVPPNTPDKGEWYSLDIEQIATAKDLNNPLEVTAYLLSGQENGAFPNVDALKIELNNNHLQYAIFWYTMALVMLAVYVLRFIKPVRKPD